MKNVPAIWLILSSIFFTPMALSFTANGKIVDGQLVWDNAYSTGDALTLSDWSPKAGMLPTTAWSPGPASGFTSSTLTLTNPTGDTAEVDVTLEGMQYNTGSANPTEGSALSGAPLCGTKDDYTAPIATVYGDSNCAASYSLENNGRVAPFYFYRPLFTFDPDGDLATELAEKAGGTYTGSIPLTITYYYISYGGALTYYTTQETLTFRITNAANELTSIEITNGNDNPSTMMGEFDVEYDTTTRTANGTSKFNVNAKGNFSTGLYLDLDSSNNYYLTGSLSGHQIDYSVQCSLCDETFLVNDGVEAQSSTMISRNNMPDNTDFDFQIIVSFVGLEAEDVTTENLTGNFTIIFKDSM